MYLFLSKKVLGTDTLTTGELWAPTDLFPQIPLYLPNCTVVWRDMGDAPSASYLLASFYQLWCCSLPDHASLIAQRPTAYVAPSPGASSLWHQHLLRARAGHEAGRKDCNILPFSLPASRSQKPENRTARPRLPGREQIWKMALPGPSPARSRFL